MVRDKKRTQVHLSDRTEAIKNILLDDLPYLVSLRKVFLFYIFWYAAHFKRVLAFIIFATVFLFIGVIPYENNFPQSSNPPILTPELEPYMEAISWSTEYAVHLFVIIALLILARIKKMPTLKIASISVLVSLIFCSLLVRVPKISFGRLRPIVASNQGVSDQFIGFTFKHKYHSFPSGHTASAFTTSSNLFALSPYIGIPCVLYSINVGAARIYLKQHYLSDTLAGASVGILSALPFFSLNRQLRTVRKADGSKRMVGIEGRNK